jgi:NAD(P)-dependent dehydrogenase (short-subunit alcohol dehydrogenase family)
MTETVVITGASAGIGRATAELFGKRGANVVLLARGLDGLQAAARAVDNAGGKALTIPTDVSDFQAVDAAASLAEAQFGPIDVWVNVAFTSVFAPFWEIKADEFRRVTEVSYLGFVHGTMAALSRMRPRNQGTIVQVGSALGYRAIPLQSAYCGAKHAINGFTESIRTELLHDHSKVKITIVQMPAVNTPQFNWVLSRLPRRPQPVPPIYEPEVAAEGVVFAADHPDRKEHWVGASTVGTIVAQKFAAPLLDQYLARTGFNSQQTDEREPANRPNNLWAPVDQPPGSDQGAHGRFDDRSKSRSAQLTVTERVEEASATVRNAFDKLLGAGRDSLRGGGRPRQPKPAPPQETWSEATSQQGDQDALQAGPGITPHTEATLPETPSPSEIRLSESGADLHQPPGPAAEPTTDGAPPLTGMDVPTPADTADPVPTENTPWWPAPGPAPSAEDTSPPAEDTAPPGVGTLSPDEGAQVADQEVMAPTETDSTDGDQPDQPQS